MLEFRTRLIRLKHKVAAHSITDPGPIYDIYHYFNICSEFLTQKFGKILNQLSADLSGTYRIVMPTIYYKNSKIFKGMDDDIVNGVLMVTAGDSMFPEIDLKVGISNRNLDVPKTFIYKNAIYSLDAEGMKKFFKLVNPRFNTGAKDGGLSSMFGGGGVATVYFGDQSKTRENLIAPIETGDEQMLGRSTGPYLGV